MYIYTFETSYPGPTSLILGSVHWNEKWGSQAIIEFVKLLKHNKAKIKKWKVILISHVNEKAFEQQKRFIDYDLNRLFKDDYPNLNEIKDTHEYQLVQKLKPILAKADFMLDLHSMEASWEPFAFAEKKVLSFAKKLGIPHLLRWWWQLYPDVTWWDTENYVNSNWWLAITLEGGSHNDPQTFKNLFQGLLNFLVATWQIEETFFKPLGEESKVLHLVDAYVSKNSYPDFKYLINPSHLKPISKSTPILRDWKNIYKAPYDFTMVMPISETRVKDGREVFFIAKEEWI